MRSIKFDQIGNASGAPRVVRPVSREMGAVNPPPDLADGSSTTLPAQREDVAVAPAADKRRPEA